MTKVAQLVIPRNVISHWNTHCLVVDQLRRSRLSNGSGSDIFVACLYFWTERLLRGLTLGFNVSRVGPNL
ncbi:hypothetical protein EMCRGX_G022606 [Ephydatia muelleri]